MKNIMHNSLVALSALLPLTLSAQTEENTQPEENAKVVPTQSSYSIFPRAQQASATPLVMLALSNDHQLYFKAYTDYDDLNGNGELDGPDETDDETTYNNSRDYDGYFSYDHCYTYSGGVFSISSATANKYCSGAAEWSGNFLNWATMTRIDMLRHVLYGGKRYKDNGAVSTDTNSNETFIAGETVLERSYLPNDAHSFAKYYNGTDLADLTPLTSDVGITICNTTIHPGSVGDDSRSRDNTNPPLMRVIKGNYSLWASGERLQCLVRDNGPVANQMGPAADHVPEHPYFMTEGLKYDKNHKHGLAVISDHENLFKTTFESFLGVDYERPKTNSPHVDDFNEAGEGDYIVRVRACNTVTATPAAGPLSRCKKYGEGASTVFKPTGVLHQFGEDDSVLWGLISGSYTDNKKGGYLRRNIGTFRDEVNSEDGTFTKKPDGIVSNIDAFRIAGWSLLRHNDDGWYGDNNANNYDGIGYNETGAGQATNPGWCRWSRKGFDNGHCVDWGNPVGEILAESYRYFAGLDGVVNNSTIGADYLAESNSVEAPTAPKGVTIAKWTPVADTQYQCSSMNVLGLNTSAQTYDRELFDIAQGIPGVGISVEYIEQQTDSVFNVGTGSYLFGRTGDQIVDSNVSCAPKELDNLSSADGVCPEAPGHEGTWLAAGLAKIVSGGHLVGTEESYDINASLSGQQTVTTHGLQLASALPQVKIPYGSRTITITPMCENWGNALGTSQFLGNCGLVDFQILSLSDTEGVFYVNWEDSEQGGDYDQDMQGLLKYEVIDNTLRVSTKVVGQSTLDRLGFGYILSGVSDTADIAHAHSGVNGYPGEGRGTAITNGCPSQQAVVYDSYQNRKRAEGRTGCGIDNDVSEIDHIIEATATPADKLPNLLDLAAQASGGEYVNVNNPDNLSAEFERIVRSLSGNKPIGTSEVAASGVSAGGLFLHTLSYPQKDKDGESVQWIGQIGALRVDENNQLRDANGAVLNFVGSGGDSKVAVTPAAGGSPTLIDFDDIQYFWSTTNTLAAQASDANKGRRIYTALVDPDGGDFVNTDLIQPTTLTEFNTDIAGDPDAALFLGVGAESAAGTIEYIVGNESDATRSRTLGNTTYLLGDIATSPLIQSTPDYSYFSEFGDSGYRDYIDTYKSARNVVYVASNDGMIHAINAGVKSGDSFASGNPTEAGAVALGEELWAYAPFNLLPHLQWLPSKNYQRVPYFDGYMRTFDVKAWPVPEPESETEAQEGDATEPQDPHIGGWGTILVVGTGMGGGHYPIQTDDDDAPEIVTKPAYIVLDITDRNATQPTVIAEISHEQLGFTTAEPEVIRRVVKSGDTETSEWYLVFGSGPRGNDTNDRRTAQTSYTVPAYEETDEGEDLSKPYLFAFKIYDGGLTPVNPIEVPVAADGAFIGSINSMDWGRDFEDDAMYFGTIAGDETTPTGKLLRATINFENGLSLSPSVMFNAEKPVVKRPVTVINQGIYWVFAGTGRYYTRGDGSETHSDNVYVGLKEGTDAEGIKNTFDFANGKLFNSDGIVVDTGGNLYNADDGSTFARDGVTLATVASLRQHIKRDEPLEMAEDETPPPVYDGWIRTFGTNERQHAQVGYLASTLFVGTTVPGAGTGCSSGDQGSLYVWDMRSGVASPFVQDEAYTRKFNTSGGKEVDAMNLPIGLDGAAPDIRDPSTPLFNTAGGGVGELPELKVDIPSRRHSWREVTIPW